jgi:cytoskeletal protein RodZ
MATVSEQFKLAREQQQLDIHQVAEITKIKTDHLRALEAGDYTVFPAPVYIKGFARTYATMLKLDVPRVLAELDVELSRDERYRDHPPLTNTPRSPLDFVMLQLSRLNWRIALGVVAGIILILIAVSMARNRPAATTTADPLKEIPPGVYQPKRDKPGNTLPLPAPPKR